ncbi:unnamed protein product, partial [Ectocarpus fasciculatus]
SETGTPLSSAEDKDGRVLFSGTVLLPRGNHKFRFVVDGEWHHDPKLLTERDEATGEVCNVVKVSPKGDLRVRLPEQMLSEDMNSAEATDYLNSLKEYGLSTPSPPKSSLKASSYFGGDGDDDGGADDAAAAATAAAAADAGGGGGGQQDDCLEQASQATRMARVMMSRRRREVGASSLAAVGACLVSSSVRKDGKVCRR